MGSLAGLGLWFAFGSYRFETVTWEFTSFPLSPEGLISNFFPVLLVSNVSIPFGYVFT